MEVNEEIKQRNRLGGSIAFSILLLFIISLSLIAFNSHTLVHANPQEEVLGINISSLVFDSDLQKERISQGPKLIYIKKGDTVYKVLTSLTDVSQILKEYNIPIERNDVVVFDGGYLVNGSVIRIVRTDAVLIETEVELPFEKKIIESYRYLKGEEKIVQTGIPGVKIEKYIYYYEDGLLVKKELIGEELKRKPVDHIVEVGTSIYTLDGITLRGYNCPYWYSVVDNGPYNEEEKRWLKFIMYCESGCNAESNKNTTYKGLFQWSVYWWRKQFPENIFDGNAQIKNTIAKYRGGESTRENQWPACHSKYRDKYPL